MFEEKRKNLVESLENRGYLETEAVKDSFLKIPREEFIPSRVRDNAYVDRPLPIGRGQTISAPSMIAIMLEALELDKGQRVLEIGTGSGYNAALIAEIVGAEGEVYTVERLESVAKVGRENLERTGYEWVEVIVGDGSKGYPEGAPWDRILVTACSPELPEPLIEQLDIDGVLAAPVGRHHMAQKLTLAKESGGKVEVEKGVGCAFVPLVGEYGWDKDSV
ncbi:MAG: protein-L-isoaspartate(D-aspartate) O-methyltransferase [Candidatus Hadarchaeia archaeon]